MTCEYDFLVIGGGSGGVRAARIAAGLGARTAIIEGRFWGGTCVNVGCVPKKLYVYGSHYAQSFREAEGFGWKMNGDPSHDWSVLKSRKDAEISRLNGIYARMLDQAGVIRHEGYARFLDAHRVQVGSQEICAEHILIATGSIPAFPDVPGQHLLQSSDRLFELERKPDRAVVWGGGYIAVEFAHILAGLGVQTSLVYRGPQVLKRFDPDIAQRAQAQLEEKGIRLYLNQHIQSVTQTGSGLQIELTTGERLQTDEVFCATGRVPNTSGLDLTSAGVETGERGQIIVNEHYTTTQPHIHAVGDVIDRVQLTPVALAEGMYVAQRLFGGAPRPVDYSRIPTAVFTQPAIATVGLTAPQAHEQGYDVAIYRADFRALKHTLSGLEERTLVKLIVDRQSDRVLGAHMVGDEAAEIIQGIAIAINSGATKADFDRTIGIHPSTAEEFVTLREPVS